MGNVSCRIVSDTSHFTCKIRVLAMSMACPCRIHAISGHHRLKEVLAVLLGTGLAIFFGAFLGLWIVRMLLELKCLLCWWVVVSCFLGEVSMLLLEVTLSLRLVVFKE